MAKNLKCIRCGFILDNKHVICFKNGTMYYDLEYNERTKRLSYVEKEFLDHTETYTFCCKYCGETLEVDYKDIISLFNEID